MAKRIYVGGLPYSATDDELKNLFERHGQVSDVHLVTDKYTGQARGFGFVEMDNDSEAESAINALNGTSMGGRTLTVNEAKPREDRPRGGGGGGYGGGGGGGRRW
ncbi:MAG: RNA-binding protein [Chthonomonadales bacterium]|nr:RNA-binding protein [Chthonomonadales bacterium]